jgi:hypothetical protein
LAYIGNIPAEKYSSFVKQDFTTSATTTYTLDQPVTNENEIALFINFVRQEPTTAYTASNTTLTLSSATTSSDDMYCVYLGKAVQTVNPPANSVGSSQLANNAVTTAKIADSNITSAKIASGVIQNQSAFKNIIMNGDMNISQRGTSFADLNGVGLDRFRFDKVNDGAVTVSQETDVPSGQGFSKSLKVDVTTADTSIGSSQYGQITQRIEAQNLQYLKYGTTNAETLTLTFWVKSNKTGTYCVSIVKIDNTRYDYIAEYSISSANTWEKKTITIAPDSNIKASGGAIDNNNDVGFYFSFILANGSGRQGTNETWNTSTPATSTSNQVNFLDSTSNEWYLTGVQLEAGTSASDFEFLPVDVNFYRCARYYLKESQGRYGAAICYSTGASSDVNWDIRAVSEFRSNSYTVSNTFQNASATVQRKSKLGFNITGSATSASGGAYMDYWEVSDEL